MPEYLEVDIESLTVADIEAIEEILEEPLDVYLDAKNPRPRGKLLRAFGYVVKRRDNPDFTIEDAGNLIVKMAEPDPTEADD